MNSLHKSYHAFIDSVCAELGCSELAHPLQEGFSVLYEASGRRQLTTEKLAEFHGLVMETVKPIVSRINRFLKPCGLSIVLDYSDEAREHFEDEPHHVAAILYSLQDEGSPVAPVAINEPMIAKYYYGTWYEDDAILEHCLSDSLWHEAGHHIVDTAIDLPLIEALPDDEDIVESFGRYMTEKTLGYDGDYDSEMADRVTGAVALLKICNSGTYSKASLRKAMAFVGNEFTEQELAERLQDWGVQEKTRQAPEGQNAIQESASSPGSPEIPAGFCPTTGAQAKVDAKLRQIGIVVDWSTYEPSLNRSWASQGMPSGTAEAYTVSEAEEAGSYAMYNKRTICFYVSVSKLARTPVEMYDVNDHMGSDYREIGVDTKFVPAGEPER